VKVTPSVSETIQFVIFRSKRLKRMIFNKWTHRNSKRLKIWRTWHI